MGEENKRNMAEQGGTCLGEIQREGVGGNLFEGDAWHKDKEWRAIGESGSTAKREGCRWAVSWEWGVDRLLRCLTGNRKWRQQLCNSCARERGGGEEGRSRAGRWGLHLNSINTIVACLSEAELICSTLSHVPSSNSKQGCTDANTSTHNLISREAHKSTDWFIKTFQEKY